MGTWEIPDITWGGKPGNRYPSGKFSNRFVKTPAVTATHGGLSISATDRSRLMAADYHNTNILGLFGGRYFGGNNDVRFQIPPYTQKQKLPVFFTDSESMGQGRVELTLPRRWPRAYGGELRG